MKRRYFLALGGATLVIALSVSMLGGTSRLPIAPEILVERAFDERSDTLRSGETLGNLLVRRGVAPAHITRLIQVAPGLNPRRLRAGQVFRFQYVVGDSTPSRITSRFNDHEVVHLVRQDTSVWEAAVEAVQWQVEELRVGGAIAGSLYLALHDAVSEEKLPAGEIDRFISDLADGVFGWEIDFTRDVYDGDRFEIVYERLISSRGDVRYGRLVAARVDTRGTPNHAYVLSDENGRNSYYDERGISLRRAFRRYPVAFLRISSGYSSRRRHPVLGIWRAHMGTDYAARTGTEIYATADGVVRTAGRNGGYGLMVSLRHPRGIETRYAHMSRIAGGVGPGVRVKQGQVIGYVGSTGLANGPHVHYEFLKNGRHQNPQRVDLGDGSPLPEGRKQEFAQVIQRYAPLLEPVGPEPEAHVAIGDL